MKKYVIASVVLYTAIILSKITGLINLSWTVILSPFWFPIVFLLFIFLVISFVLLYKKAEENK